MFLLKKLIIENHFFFFRLITSISHVEPNLIGGPHVPTPADTNTLEFPD
jgi:hypothetical protein